MYENPCYLYDEISKTELVVYLNSNISYPLHNHSGTFSIGLILTGSIKLQKAGKQHIYKAGQTFLIPPYLPHSLDSLGKSSLLTICINKNKFSEVNISKLIKRISFLYTKILKLGFFNNKQLLLLKENMIYCKNYFPVHNSVSPQIKQLRQTLEAKPEITINIEKMAESAYMSKYHFIRKFKKETGLTPHQFQIQNKIRKAQRIFKRKKDISEVALETGFFDQSHFTRYFKKTTGLTPAVYKKAFTIITHQL